MKTVIEMAKEAGLLTIGTADGSEAVYTWPKGITEEIDRFAELVRADAIAAEREACSRVKAAKPRKLKPVGRGMLLDEQQYCFDKGWREGAASVRAAIRARSNT